MPQRIPFLEQKFAYLALRKASSAVEEKAYRLYSVQMLMTYCWMDATRQGEPVMLFIPSHMNGVASHSKAGQRLTSLI